MSTVLACGVAVLDVQQTVDRLPGPDEKLVATGLLVASGGPAANAAVTAAALGVGARLVTRIGDSPLGTLITADLAAHSVEVIDRAGPLDQPAISTVLVTRGTGQRAVVSVNASQHWTTRPDGGPDAVDWAPALVAGADVVLVDGHHLDLALPLAGAARAAGVPVLLDGGSWKPGLERLLALVDIALISAVLQVPHDLARSTGRPADDVLATVGALGPPVVARSRGPLPIDVLTGAVRSEVPVPHVEVVDTLGAGDVLHGALSAWLAVRGTSDVHNGLAWAARVAADSCTAAGARGWLADEHRLARHRTSLAPHPPSGSPSKPTLPVAFARADSTPRESMHNGSVPGREERTQLRGAIARGDGAAVIDLLTGRPWPEDWLQLVGDGLLVALRHHVDGSGELAHQCAAMLRTRGWEGDEELADSLQARLGTAPTRLLRPLLVDLEELAMVLEGDPVQGGGRIDLSTGEVWPQAAIDYAVEVGEIDADDDDPDSWLWVHCEGSRAGYRDMQWFIAHLDDADVAERLSIAISGRGAFRRFKDTLSAWPDLAARWFAFSEDRQRGRARAWLAGEGYDAMPPAPRR